MTTYTAWYLTIAAAIHGQVTRVLFTNKKENLRLLGSHSLDHVKHDLVSTSNP
mgnify:FL=1